LDVGAGEGVVAELSMLDGAGADGCVSCDMVEGVVVGWVLCVAGVAGSVVVWADTYPTVPTITAAARAVIKFLEAFMVKLLLGRCRGYRPIA
jgi:hypothetical protein